MNDNLWRLIGRWLRRHAAWVAWWIGWVRRRPGIHFDGCRQRWWLPGGMQLQHILRSEPAPFLRHQPGPCRVVVLTGWLEAACGTAQGLVRSRYAVGDSYRGGRQQGQRIVAVAPGGAYVLVIHGWRRAKRPVADPLTET